MIVFAHLIFHADISQGADCASEQQCSCKWEWGGGDINSRAAMVVVVALVGGGGGPEKNTGLFILPDILLSFECAAALRKAP